jgi:hypothetical protein
MNCAPTLGAIVRGFKSVVARRVHAAGFTDFGWQRNYYEHVIRTPREKAFWRRFGDRRRSSKRDGSAE